MPNTNFESLQWKLPDSAPYYHPPKIFLAGARVELRERIERVVKRDEVGAFLMGDDRRLDQRNLSQPTSMFGVIAFTGKIHEDATHHHI